MIRLCSLFAAFSCALLATLADAAVSQTELDSARALLEARNDADAQRAYEAIVHQDPSNPDALRALGQLALRRDDADAAVSWFEKAVAAEPAHADTHRLLGDSYGRKAQKAGMLSKFGLAKKCLASYERAVAADPKDVRSHESLFNYYHNAPAIAGGGADKAHAEATILKQLDPARGALAFAQIHQSQKNYRDALADYDAYLQLTPDDFYVNYLVGKLCDTNNVEPQRGLAALRRCLELPQLTPPAAPKYQHVHWRIGNILRAQGDLAGARAAYETSAQIDPTFEHSANALKELSATVARTN